MCKESNDQIKVEIRNPWYSSSNHIYRITKCNLCGKYYELDYKHICHKFNSYNFQKEG